MDFNEYQSAAAKTAIYPREVEGFGPVMYCTLKLTSEIGELKDGIDGGAGKDAIVKEAGDVLWYVAMMAKEIGITLDWEHSSIRNPSTVFRIDELCERMMTWTLELCSRVGKAYRDSDGSVNRWQVVRIEMILTVLSIAIADLMWTHFDTSYNDILQANIAKLADRQNRGVIRGSGDER